MPIQANKVNATVSVEAAAAIEAAVDGLFAALPFLQALTDAERRRLVKLGDKSEAFVTRAHQIVRDHPAAVPGGLEVADMDRDARIRELLLPVHQRLLQLLALVDDTMTLAGHDLMTSALIVYRNLQSHGEAAGLKALRNELAVRFARGPRQLPQEPVEGE